MSLQSIVLKSTVKKGTFHQFKLQFAVAGRKVMLQNRTIGTKNVSTIWNNVISNLWKITWLQLNDINLKRCFQGQS